MNVAAALDGIGGLLGVERFECQAGYGQLLAWLRSFGTSPRSGSKAPAPTGPTWPGSGPAGVEVVEVDRPDRQARRVGKSDPVDAVEAARAAQSGRAWGAKRRDGTVEAIRALVVARRRLGTKITVLNQIRHLVFSAPDDLRERLSGVSSSSWCRCGAATRPGP